MLQEHVEEEDEEDLEEMEEAWTVPDVTLPDLHIRDNDVDSSTAHQQEEVLTVPEAESAACTDTTNAPTARDGIARNAAENPTRVSLLFFRHRFL